MKRVGVNNKIQEINNKQSKRNKLLSMENQKEEKR
jgi:hypothetical protein